MKILMCASESNPYIKSGGLADVIYALSKEMVKLDNEVMIVLPLYRKIKEKNKNDLFFIGYHYINIGNRKEYLGLYKIVKDGITFYFVDNEDYFNRENLYGYDDDARRFAYFSMAICSSILYLNLSLDIVHVHDHQVGMVPLLLKEYYHYKVKTILTIHNPAFQGLFNPYRLGELYNMNSEFYDNGLIRFNNECSTLKAAIMTANKITTVSPNHRLELINGEYDYGLHHVLKFRDEDFIGIVNGVDTDEFNPLTDKEIKKNFSDENIKDKNVCKNAFIKEYGFNKDYPLYGLVSRLTSQKGIELLLDSLTKYLDRINVFILGSGDKYLEEKVLAIKNKYSNFNCYIGYSNDLAHKVYSSVDFFFMPSLYEPCGIGQMIAHRYASLPIVRNTGGLKDTVDDLKDGIIFNDFNIDGMTYAIDKSLEIYSNKRKLLQMKHNAIKKDHSWQKSTIEYLNLYKEILNK